MPAVSEKQRRFFAIAESMKQGKTKKSYSPAAAKLAQSLTSPKLKDFTRSVKPKIFA